MIYICPFGMFFRPKKCQKMEDKGYELSHVFHFSLNSLHKNPILKNSKKAYAVICRPVALKDNYLYASKFN